MDKISGEEKKVWGIHTQDQNLFLNKDKGVIAIGWKEMGDLSKIGADRNNFKSRYSEVYPDATKNSISTCSGMLYRFVHEMNINDYVVFPSKQDRKVNLGIVKSEYFYQQDADLYVQQRKVTWLKHLPRIAFSQGALCEIGSAMTFFSVKNYADEFLEAIDIKNNKSILLDSAEDETIAWTAEDIIESTKDFVLKRLSVNLKGYDLEDFIVNLLCAMGYRTVHSPRGGDGGIDITAYKGEFPPRILVQVKSQDRNIKEKEIQSLKGAMIEGDYGLFITLSDYNKNADNYLKKTPIIRGINGAELVDLILKYYDKLSEKYRKMIPLKMVYIPVPIENDAHRNGSMIWEGEEKVVPEEGIEPPTKGY